MTYKYRKILFKKRPYYLKSSKNVFCTYIVTNNKVTYNYLILKNKMNDTLMKY